MTTANKLSLEHTYHIRSYEPLPGGRVSIATICNLLQDMAARHADSLGFGLLDLQTSGHYWVLARLHLMLDRLPGYGETVTVETWPSGNERLVALRDFTIMDGSGVIGRATTSWVTLNAKTHRPDPPETVLDGRLIPDRERSLVFPTKAITRLKQGEHTAALEARRSDIDINGHVNNVKYVEFCLEPVPEEWAASRHCLGLDIQFRTESHPGDAYTASCTCEQDGDTFLHSLTRDSDDREVVRMRTWWQKA